MWTKFSVEILLLLTLIPLPPGPSIFRIPCCRDNSRIVRKIVQSKLLPVLEKHNVEIGLECPFHPERDLFAPQQTAKQQHRPSQWTCSVCAKSFYEEKFLDLHFANRHKERINAAEDAVCLANYCDIMRCDVLAAFEGTLLGGRASSTDIEVWRDDRTAVVATTTTSGSRSTKAKGSAETTTSRSGSSSSSSLNNKSHQSSSSKQAGDSSSATCDRSRHRKNLIQKNDEEEDDEEEEEEEEDDAAESSGTCSNSKAKTADKDKEKKPTRPLDRKQQRIVDMQRMKANCKKEDLDKLRAKCQVLIRDCIGGLLVNLSTQEFKEMEDELNRKICWYLSCDRYWEDGVPDRRAFPWILLIVAATILSCGICLCYYIIWVLFDSDDYKFFMINSSSNQTLAAHQSLNPHHQQQLLTPPLHNNQPSPTHSRSYVSLHHPQQQNMMNNNIMLAEKPLMTSYNPTDCLEMSDVIAGGAVSTAGTAGNSSAATVAGQEHYIYVTYPPELKRRLLESCYNRTTRL